MAASAIPEPVNVPAAAGTAWIPRGLAGKSLFLFQRQPYAPFTGYVLTYPFGSAEWVAVVAGGALALPLIYHYLHLGL